MSLSNNLLYFLLVYAVLDNDNRLSTTTGILLALGIMLFGCCNRAINACCGNGCDNNFRTSTTTTTTTTNPFRTVNNII